MSTCNHSSGSVIAMPYLEVKIAASALADIVATYNLCGMFAAEATKVAL